MKPLICLCLLLLPPADPADIVWGARQLSWSDFKGRPDPESSSIASIRCDLVAGEPQQHNGAWTVEVKAVFRGNISWTITDMPSVLSHESKHFDITEIYARRLRKKLSEQQFSPKTIASEVRRMYEVENSAMDHYQDEYDEATDHSMNLRAQRKWDKMLETELKKLEAWSATAVQLNGAAKPAANKRR